MVNETPRSVIKMQRKANWEPKQPWKLFPDANLDPRDCVGKRREGGKNQAVYLTKTARITAMQAVAPLLQMGYRHAKVGEILGLTVPQVKRLVSHRDFPVILGEYQERMLGATRDALMAAQVYAVWTLMSLLDSGSDYVRQQAANSLLVHGKIMDQVTGAKGSQEQTELLSKLSKELEKPRVRVEVSYEGGRLQLKRITESRRAPSAEVIDAEVREVEAGDADTAGDTNGEQMADGDVGEESEAPSVEGFEI